MHVSPLTLVLQAALPVCFTLCLAVALQALVLQQSFLPLQLPQTGLQTLPVAHLKKRSENNYFSAHQIELLPPWCIKHTQTLYKSKPNWTFWGKYMNFACKVTESPSKPTYRKQTFVRVTEHIIPSSENQVNKPANIKNRTETQKLQHLQLLCVVHTLGISLPLPQVLWWFSRAGYWQTCRRNMHNRCELRGKWNKTLFTGIKSPLQVCKSIISRKLLNVCIINQSVWIFCLLLDHVNVFKWYSHSTCICAPDHPYAASRFSTALLGGAVSSGALPTVKRSHSRRHAWDKWPLTCFLILEASWLFVLWAGTGPKSHLKQLH